MLTDYQNSFTVRLSGKFATNSYLNISQHPCYVQKNRHPQEAIEANGHVSLSHSKNSFKIFV